MLDKLISGGPTGGDRAGLDVGLALGLIIGGGPRTASFPTATHWRKPRSRITTPAAGATSRMPTAR